MKKGRIILLLCTITILAGCAGNENQKHQDGQEIATIDFHDLQNQEIQNQEIQNQEIQNQEGGFSETDQTDTNSSTSENDDNTQNAIAAEPLESSSKAPEDNPQKNGTVMDLYAGFLKNEVPVNVASDYPQNDCFVYNLEPGKSYTFTTLGDYVNMRYLNPEHSQKTSYDYAQYVYLDSPDSRD